MADRELMSPGKPTGLPPGVTPEQVAAEQSSETPTAAEQQQYDKFVSRAIAFIHDEKTQPAVLNMMNQSGDDIHVNVGRAAARIVQMIEQSAAQAGDPIGEDVLYAGGQEIVADLLETGVEAKIFPLSVDSQEYDQALELSLLEAMKAYGEDLLKGPEGKQVSAQAQDAYASEVAAEADAGYSDPALAAMLDEQSGQYGVMNRVSAGVKEAVGE